MNYRLQKQTELDEQKDQEINFKNLIIDLSLDNLLVLRKEIIEQQTIYSRFKEHDLFTDIEYEKKYILENKVILDVIYSKLLKLSIKELLLISPKFDKHDKILHDKYLELILYRIRDSTTSLNTISLLLTMVTLTSKDPNIIELLSDEFKTRDIIKWKLYNKLELSTNF
jgi:hypothetical protein